MLCVQTMHILTISYRIEDSTSAERRPALCVLFQFRAGFSVSALQWFIKYRYQVHLSSSEISMFQSSVDMVCVLFDFYSSFCSGSAWNCFPFKEQKLCNGSMWDQMIPNSVFAWVYLLDSCKQHALAQALKISFHVGEPSMCLFFVFLSKTLHTFHSCSNHLEEKNFVCSEKPKYHLEMFYHVKLAIKKSGVDVVYTLFSSTAISLADGIYVKQTLLFFWCN